MNLKKILKRLLTALMVIPLSLTIATNRVFAYDSSVPSYYYLLYSYVSSYYDTSAGSTKLVNVYGNGRAFGTSFILKNSNRILYYFISDDIETGVGHEDLQYGDVSYKFANRVQPFTLGKSGVFYNFKVNNHSYRSLCIDVEGQRVRVPQNIPVYELRSEFDSMDYGDYLPIILTGKYLNICNVITQSDLYAVGYIPAFKNWVTLSINALNAVYFQSMGYPMTGYHVSWDGVNTPVPEPTETPEPTEPPTPEPTKPPTPEPSEPPLDNSLIKNQPIVEYWDTFVKALKGVFEEHLNNIEGFLKDIKQGLKDFKDETTNIINNPKQTNFWDFLKEVISTFITDFFETLQNAITDFFQFTEHTIDLLDKAFRSIGKYLADRLDFLFVPSDSQQSEIKTKIANLKDKSGGIGQLSDTVIGYYNGFESVVESGQVIFQWSDITIPDGTVIPGGAFNVSQCIFDSGFGPVQETVKIVFTFSVVVVTIKRCLKHILKMLGVDISL